MDRKLGRKRRFLQRIGLGARLFRRDIDCDDILAALDERVEHRLAESLLPVNDDTHLKPLSNCFTSPARRENGEVTTPPRL